MRQAEQETANQAELAHLLREAVDDGVVPGLVAVVGRAEQEAPWYSGAAGTAHAGTGQPMGTDAVFRIASMTKAVTAVAVLQLAERGLITLDTPVGDVLPAFNGLDVVVSAAPPRYRRPHGRATFRQILAGTSGVSSAAWSGTLTALAGRHGSIGLPPGSRDGLLAPLIADPGTGFYYGKAVDWAGLAIERITGRRLGDYLAEHVFAPLGMTSASTTPAAPGPPDLVPIHRRDAAGAWSATELDYYPAGYQPEYHPGSSCIYATATDFLRFQLALLDPGRIISADSAAVMLSDQAAPARVGELTSVNQAMSYDVRFPPGTGWGLGLAVRGHLAGWAGGFNTYYLIDRERGLAAGLYAQAIPFWDSRITHLAARFFAAAGLGSVGACPVAS